MKVARTVRWGGIGKVLIYKKLAGILPYYSLPAVFLGSERSVIATWWTMDGNGKKVKHREERVIDFLNADLTGFYFGVPPTPTPIFTPTATPTLRPPYDKFYNEKVTEVLSHYDQWEIELGKIEANQHIIQWLNGQVRRETI